MISKIFQGTIQNTYRKTKLSFSLLSESQSLFTFNQSSLSSDLISNLTSLNIQPHIFEIAVSKFVLCPSGLGMDTYRLWETLLLGSIPIVESNKGFDRTYSLLPVMVVSNYSIITPQLLENAYPCFVKNIEKFHYELLSESYWTNLIRKAIVTGNIEHLTTLHPPNNPYCNFLDLR
jgi:hypothetical protein